MTDDARVGHRDEPRRPPKIVRVPDAPPRPRAYGPRMHGIVGTHFVQSVQTERERELAERIALSTPRSAPVTVRRVSRRRRAMRAPRRALAV